jgi:hypothetical protein
MIEMRTRTRWHGMVLTALLGVLAACANSSSEGGGSGGVTGSGGVSASGGVNGSGGVTTSGGSGGMAGSGGAGGGTSLSGLEQFGAKYSISNTDVSGWREATEAEASTGHPLALFTDANLTDRIDGPADNYVQHGCKYAMYQELVGPDPELCLVVAMDFGTAANASSMVAYQKTDSPNATAIPGYDAAVGFVYETLTGVTLYASLKSLYVQLEMDGYGDDKTKGAEDGAAILKVLESKNK